MRPITVEVRDDFDEFYAASFKVLTLQLYAYLGDLAEAQDVVQEAFCRAYSKWRKISGYDQPVSWVRRVAWNIATSRFRRQRTATNFLLRQREEYVDGPSSDRVALTAALAKIPAQQRRAVVLHYLAEMSVLEIAEQERVAEGTVKSWLSRAVRRSVSSWRRRREECAMSDNYDNLISEAFDEFADRAAPAITAAGSQAVRATVIHRRRIRITTLSLLGALLIAVPVVTFAGDPRGNNGPPDIAASGATPSEEPAPSTESSTTPSTEPSASQYASSTPDGRMTADDLRDQPMLGCPQKPKIGMPVHTNLDDDPALETAVALVCGVSDPGPVKLMAYDRDATGAIVVLGQIIHDAARVDIIRNLTARTARTAGGVRAEVCILCGSDPDPDRWQIREYAWVGGKFAQVGGPTAPPVDKFAQLGFTVTDGEFKADDNGRNHKNYSLVITNTGTATSARFQLKALYDNPGDEWKLTGADWVGDSATAWHEGLAAGGSFTIVVNYSWPAAWAFTGSYFQLVGDNGPLTGQVVFNGGRT